VLTELTSSLPLPTIKSLLFIALSLASLPQAYLCQPQILGFHCFELTELTSSIPLPTSKSMVFIALSVLSLSHTYFRQLVFIALSLLGLPQTYLGQPANPWFSLLWAR